LPKTKKKPYTPNLKNRVKLNFQYKTIQGNISIETRLLSI
jgi:hypothetical protein